MDSWTLPPTSDYLLHHGAYPNTQKEKLPESARNMKRLNTTIFETFLRKQTKVSYPWNAGVHAHHLRYLATYFQAL